MSDKPDFRTLMQCFGAIEANCPGLKWAINHLERIQWAVKRWVKSLRGLTYEERLKALKLQPLGQRRLRNDLVLTHIGNRAAQIKKNYKIHIFTHKFFSVFYLCPNMVFLSTLSLSDQ